MDRYMPSGFDDEYELTREDLHDRHEHSHKHKKRTRDKDEDRHRNKTSRDKRSHSADAERPPRRPASEEPEDGEIEDGEIPEADEQAASPPRGSDAANGVDADDAVNGKRRHTDEDGTGGPAKHRSASPSDERVKQPEARNSSRPPSGRDRDSSRDRERPAGSSRDHKSSRDRSKERSSSRREREREPERQQQRDRQQSRHSSREPSSRAAADAAAAADGGGRYGSSRNGTAADGSSRQDRAAADRDRDRDRGGREFSRQERYERDREYDRDRYRRERDSRYGDAAAAAAGSGREDRKRRSRSRSRSRRRGDERDRHHKRSRDERDGDERRRRHRHSKDDSPDPELDLPDPNALLAADPLGLSAAEREAEEEQRRLEESRKRRQAILAKHQQAAAVAAPTATAAAAGGAGAGGGADAAAGSKQQQQPVDGSAAAAGAAAEAAVPPAAAAAAAAGAGAAGDAADGAATPEGERSSSEDSHNAPGSPVMDIWNRGAAAGGGGTADDVSSRPAEDEQPTSQLPVHMVVAGTEPNMQSERLRVGGGAAAAAAAAATSGSKAAAAAAGDDMFAAEDDMFGDDDGAVAGGVGQRRGPAVPAGLLDNYDDAEGYYNFQVGEVLDGRYEVFACKGKGVFSTVLRARDLFKPVQPQQGQPAAAGTEYSEVAIKVIRSNETMSKAAALEQRILKLLAEKDPENKKHVIRLLRTFEYRQHVCMVFEPLDMNLRELTLKYGRNVGLNITAVAIYAAQLLVALRHLQQCRVLHADIKPDNILVNARRSKVKVCDLGSAMLAGENERTPYLVSRFYRSPEVILGLAYDFPMDMWSVGCVLYELFTGKILFPGRTNNEMLKLMMDVKGPFPKKMLKRGIFVEKHFEDDAQMSFALVEEDPVTKQPVRRIIGNPTVKHNFAQLLARAEGDRAQVANLADLLERMCALDPDKRIQADAALRHPFVKPWLPKKKTAAGGAAGHP